jgi:hypothetical protein
MNRIGRFLDFFRNIAVKIMFLPLEATFHSNNYLRLNSRRLEHLSSLELPIAGRTVLEVGAGIGDHSHFYVDRNCIITITEARKLNLDYLRMRYPSTDIRRLDLDHPEEIEGGPFDIIHCYGVLYHLRNPDFALRFLSQHCGQFLFLETCVSTDEDPVVDIRKELTINPTQSVTGFGSRPSRSWLYDRLTELFEFVYIPRTQPYHEDFALDWSESGIFRRNNRAIFIASRIPIENEFLSPELLSQQRHNL